MIFQHLVTEELGRARRKHGPVRGLHEGYAVLLEEVDEFWELVKQQKPDPQKMKAELVQIAAMAQKITEDVVQPLLDVATTPVDRPPYPPYIGSQERREGYGD